MLDFKANMVRCIEGIEARMKEEEAEAQLLRPSSAQSDGSELLRAAIGACPDDKPELLLRPSSAQPEELSTTKIASQYLKNVSEESTSVESVHPVHPV